MTTQTNWPDMTTPDKNAALAEMMGKIPCDKWTSGSMGSAGGFCMFSHFDLCGHKPDECYPAVPDLVWPGNGPRNYTENYTACFEVVAWAKEQGWSVTIIIDPANSGYTVVKDFLGARLSDVLGYSPDAICQAIWEAAMAMRKE